MGVGERRLGSTQLLCLVRSLCSGFPKAAFRRLLPEIGRAGRLAKGQLGIMAGARAFCPHAPAIPRLG